jgi:hypothetical protein
MGLKFLSMETKEALKAAKVVVTIFRGSGCRGESAGPLTRVDSMKSHQS